MYDVGGAPESANEARGAAARDPGRATRSQRIQRKVDGPAGGAAPAATPAPAEAHGAGGEVHDDPFGMHLLGAEKPGAGPGAPPAMTAPPDVVPRVSLRFEAEVPRIAAAMVPVSPAAAPAAIAHLRAEVARSAGQLGPRLFQASATVWVKNDGTWGDASAIGQQLGTSEGMRVALASVQMILAPGGEVQVSIDAHELAPHTLMVFLGRSSAQSTRRETAADTELATGNLLTHSLNGRR